MTKIPSDALRQAFIGYGWSMGVWLETVPRETPPSEVTHTHHSCTMFYVPFSKPFSDQYFSLVLLHTHTHTPCVPTHPTHTPPYSHSPTHTHTHTHTHSLRTLVSHTSWQSLMMGEMCSQDHFLTNSRRQTTRSLNIGYSMFLLLWAHEVNSTLK